MLSKADLKRMFIIGIITSLVLSAGAGIFVLLTGSFDLIDGKILGTTLAIGLFSITSLADLRNFESEQASYRSFALIGLGLSLIALVLVTLIIWSDTFIDMPWKPAAVSSILAISAAHASLLLPARGKNAALNSAVTVTLGMIALVAGLIIYLVLGEDTEVGDMFYRLLGVFAILDVLGTILVPILSKFLPSSPGSPPESSSEPPPPAGVTTNLS
jgi:hypothetical protein